MAMLAMLKGYQKKLDFALGAVHVHHGIRGEEANRDEALVRQMCDLWEIPFLAYHYPVPEIAKEKNINFLFEASCGGGIPIIRALNSSLTADEIDELTGILNGTTNYMLDKMNTEGADFGTVLKEAQEKGYAEADPTADVEGQDACRKIAILSSLAYSKFLNYEDIYTEGITKITSEDMEYAREMQNHQASWHQQKDRKGFLLCNGSSVPCRTG